jgi:hypothetical protein
VSIVPRTSAHAVSSGDISKSQCFSEVVGVSDLCQTDLEQKASI